MEISSRNFLLREGIVNIFPWSFFACNLENLYQISFPELTKGLYMQIQTSDNATVDNFEGIQAVVRKIQNTMVMKNVSGQENPGEVSYNGHSIQANDHAQLTGQIPNLLDDMSLCCYNGEACSGSDNVFQEKFAKCLNFLLAWLCSIQLAVGVATQVAATALMMKDALGWLEPAMKHLSIYSNNDLATIDSAINQL
jgi:hypothetical protein